MNNLFQLILLWIFVTMFCGAEAQMSDMVKYAQNFKGDFLFTKSWHYPPYIEKDSKTGKFRNQFTGQKAVAADTQHIYQSCNCICDFQGRHKVTYCIAIKNNDTLVLNFTNYDGLGYLKVKIHNGIYGSQFYYTFEAPVQKDQPPNFQTATQKLTLNTTSIEAGQKIKGEINIEFTMDYYLQNGSIEKKPYHFNGLFATTITN